MVDNRRVIKGGSDQSLARTAAPVSLASLEQKGRDIVERAREQARKIVADALAQARTEAETLRGEARASGHREGFDRGLAEGAQQGRTQAMQEAAAEIEQMRRTVDEVAEQLVQKRQSVVRQARHDLLELAVAVAARLVKGEVNRDSVEVARRNLEAALELAALKSKVWIHVSPADAASLKEHLGTVAGLFDNRGDVELLADKSIARGGAVVRTESGEVDAQLCSQLEKIETELLHPTGRPPGQDADNRAVETAVVALPAVEPDAVEDAPAEMPQQADTTDVDVIESNETDVEKGSAGE